MLLSSSLFHIDVYYLIVRMSFHISKSDVSHHEERIVHVAQLSWTLSTQHRLFVRVPRSANRARPRQIRLLRRRRNCPEVRT